MEIFDKVKGVVSDLAGTTEKKSKELYNITKLKLAIADKQNQIKKIYGEIGFEAYKADKDEADIKEAILAKIERIDSIEDYVASLRKKIDDIKSIKPVGVDDISEPDEMAQEADFEEAPNEAEEAETEPIEPIE